ncbi:MAG: cell division protein FtsZ, partial [Solirubrobacteraceae bacterium]|nr:cell division protein FtsZ [Solirubrobacteraceae bacterium]
LGIGMGTGENRAVDAANIAVSSPLLETSMEGAHSILLSITGGRDMSLWEINEAAKAVSDAAHPEANIIFGAMVDETLEDQVWVTVVATRYGGSPPAKRLQEPMGEPRVERRPRQSAPPPPPVYRGPDRDDQRRAPARDDYRRAPEPEPVRSGGGLRVTELDVPEFIPRGR